MAAAWAPQPPTLVDRPSVRNVMEGDQNENPCSSFDLCLGGEPSLRAKMLAAWVAAGEAARGGPRKTLNSKKPTSKKRRPLRTPTRRE